MVIDRILTTLLIVAVIVIIVDLYAFKNTGDRYTACDGNVHEHVYHDVDLLDKCKDI